MNSKGHYHGYQEWYASDGKMCLRGNSKNGRDIGYNERHYTKRTTFDIR